MQTHASRFRRPALSLLLGSALLASCAGLGMGGCAGRGSSGYARAFPVDAPQADTIDIQVIRDNTKIVLTNTTPRAFGPSTLWINEWYSRPIEGLGVGETLELHLGSFRDEFGQPFRAGGLLAPENPDRVVSAHLEPGVTAAWPERGIEERRATASAELLPLVVVTKASGLVR